MSWLRAPQGQLLVGADAFFAPAGRGTKQCLWLPHGAFSYPAPQGDSVTRSLPRDAKWRQVSPTACRPYCSGSMPSSNRNAVSRNCEHPWVRPRVAGCKHWVLFEGGAPNRKETVEIDAGQTLNIQDPLQLQLFVRCSDSVPLACQKHTTFKLRGSNPRILAYLGIATPPNGSKLRRAHVSGRNAMCNRNRVYVSSDTWFIRWFLCLHKQSNIG